MLAEKREKAGSETVVAVIPVLASVEGEEALSRSISTIELEAEMIVIESDEDYKAAAEFGRRVKGAAAEVVEFFRPMKADAYRVHQTICSREKDMLVPLSNAEGTIKRTMGDFAQQRERERREAEEIAKRIAQEEVEAQLEEAMRAEKAGDTVAAEAAMQDAQMAESFSRDVSIPSVAPPKAAGVSQSKDWEIVGVNGEEVPVLFSGVELRPVDLKAVMRLIKASRGTVKIPGITYREQIKTTIRR